MRTRPLITAATLLVLTSCGDAGKQDVTAEPSTSLTSAAAGPMPSAVPAAGGKVTSTVPVTILDDGGGAELCLGGVLDSYPPQCGGPRVSGWAWADHGGDFEDANGVRWGEFVVTGTFDGTVFTVARAVPADEYDAPASPSDGSDLATPCQEPAGGWAVLDRARTTTETMEATFERATQLPGYAEAWMDQSRNPAYGTDDAEVRMNDPAYVTINVRVTEDVDGAEAALRTIWGGALCVSKAQHTEKELLRIQRELESLPGMLGSAPGRDGLEVQVVHDDGSLQAWADAAYGPGVVRISSALVPASG